MAQPAKTEAVQHSSAFERLLTTQEAAQLLNVPVSTLQWQAARGHWPCVRLSKRLLRWRASDLERIVAGEFLGSTPEKAQKIRKAK